MKKLGWALSSLVIGAGEAASLNARLLYEGADASAPTFAIRLIASARFCHAVITSLQPEGMPLQQGALPPVIVTCRGLHESIVFVVKATAHPLRETSQHRLNFTVSVVLQDVRFRVPVQTPSLEQSPKLSVGS